MLKAAQHRDVTQVCNAAEEGRAQSDNNCFEDPQTAVELSYSWEGSPDRLSLASAGVRSLATASQLNKTGPHASVKVAKLSADKGKQVMLLLAALRFAVSPNDLEQKSDCRMLDYL